jgi:hypothetical protein
LFTKKLYQKFGKKKGDNQKGCNPIDLSASQAEWSQMLHEKYNRKIGKKKGQ